MAVRLRLIALCLAGAVLGLGCAGSSGGPPPTPRSDFSGGASAQRVEIVRAAESMIGRPYRSGGASPSGFDCSGLVLFSYAKAGIEGLPHSARALESHAQAVAIEDLQPGDLLFFHLSGRKASHVGIYMGERAFVHAPSSGKRVERVSFDHVYWGKRVRLAGQLLP